MIFAGSIFSACQQHHQRSKSEKNTLFRIVFPKESGIRFANQLQETDSANSIFYEYYYNGAGLAIGDVNNDGLSDIFFGANMSKSRLYLNKGNLKFEDITENCGINTLGKWVIGVSLVDINQDGWLDDDRYSTQAEFFDYDRDGDNDLYVVSGGSGLPPGNPFYTDRLYINNGKGEFVMDKNVLPDNRVCGSQVTAADFDKDGDIDYAAGNGKGRFSPVPGKESGFFADGDTKGMSELTMRDESSLILIARNSDRLKVIKPLKQLVKFIRLKDDEVCAELTYKTG